MMMTTMLMESILGTARLRVMIPRPRSNHKPGTNTNHRFLPFSQHEDLQPVELFSFLDSIAQVQAASFSRSQMMARSHDFY
jgi:hypothetical protein